MGTEGFTTQEFQLDLIQRPERRQGMLSPAPSSSPLVSFKSNRSKTIKPGLLKKAVQGSSQITFIHLLSEEIRWPPYCNRKGNQEDVQVHFHVNIYYLLMW